MPEECYAVKEKTPHRIGGPGEAQLNLPLINMPAECFKLPTELEVLAKPSSISHIIMPAE